MRCVVLYACVCSLSVFWGCGYDRFGDFDAPARQPVPATMDIGDVKALYKGSPLAVRDEVVVAGYVSANDLTGNFYRTFVIEDHTGAIEVRAGLYNLHNSFPLGRYVAVRAKGLTVGAYDGVLQIGLAPSEPGGYQTEYFGYRAVMDDYVFAADMFVKVEPVTMGIDALTESLCGRLVRIEDLTFVRPDDAPGEVTWAVRETAENEPEMGYRLFENPAGQRIAVVTSGYAGFAGEVVPARAASLTGILMYGRTDRGQKMYMLKMRDAADVEVR